MLKPEEVKPLLIHEDHDVRAWASDYFANSGTTDTEVLDLSLQAVLKLGQANVLGFSLVGNLRKLPAGPSAPILLHQVLEKAERDSVLREVNHAVGRLPLDLWDRHAAAFEGCRNLRDSTRQRIERRRRFAGMDGQQVFGELDQFGTANHDKAGSEIDHAMLEDLLEALSDKGYPEAGRLQAMVTSEIDPDLWLHAHLVKLAGWRRTMDLVPQLVDFLSWDDYEVLQAEAERSLAWMGDPRAIDLIRAKFLKSTWVAKLYASGVLGAIHDERAERAILGLLRLERSEEHRGNLCMALVDQFSRQGIERISRELEESVEMDDSIVVDLEEGLLTLSIALNVEIPQKERLLAERAFRDRRMLEAKDLNLEDYEDFGEYEDSKDFEEDDELFPPSEDEEGRPYPVNPIRSERAPRPNDKCPCGSGKKFKKCCATRT